ncbi:hypothetical protein JTE90_009583 [Oedothorax gibbosus]|uniref:Ubiquitin-like protease family profile domain-containing protein n=1 Tax=Oedothorax gibbosus TaxID=931172 RepID=A0AAV6VHV4_9ARAC|nr:hypothetical protein JTE90_009583 [Oedothorax gibbosus]
MNQASSNSSMPKSTAEALKLIQKKGLSISIVSRDNSRSSQPAPAESPVGAKEMKPKQIVSVDKTTKLPIRSSVVTENKATLSQARSMPNALSETRNSSGQTPNSAHFQENIISGVINKTLVPISTSSETRAAQAWNNLPESKLQASCNQIAQSVAENKNLQAGRHVQGQLIYSEGKIQVAKSSPNISEGIKVQSRISQATGQPSHIAGRNAQGNQVKSPMSSPPLEKKVLNTDRQPQNFENLQQRLVSESNQTKFVVSNKVGDVTLPTQLRVSQIMKGTPAERIQSPKVQQLSNVGFQVRVPSVERSPATVDEKTLVKPKRLTQNTVLPKNLASVQIQKLPNTSMHSDFATIGQVVKITSSPSDSSQRQSFENLESTPSGKITMSSSRATPKRAPAARTLTNSPVAKKKCVKKMSPEKISGLNNLEARTPKGIEMQNRGLTITPIATSSSAVNTKATAESSIISSGSQVVRCPYCEKHSFRFDYCEHCGEVLPVNAPKYRLKKLSEIPMASRETVMVTKNVTTTSTIEKKIVYHLPDGMGPVNQSYQSISMRENVVFETSSPLGTRGGRGRGKTRRKAEPVCYTLSSDDDEPPVVMHPMQASSIHSSQVYNPNESEGSKSDHSSNSEMLHNELHDENQEDSDDLQYPGVTDINPNIEEDEPEEEMEFEAEEIEEEEENFSEECEEEEEEIPEEEHNDCESLAQSGRHPSLRCRSIRIGSYKVHPRPTQPFVAVVLDEGRISFNAPIISDPGGTQVHITLGSEDVHKMYFHFGRCLPVMFITTTPKFGGLVRTALHMIENETPYFDPSTKDDKTQKLTFLIESISEQQKSFLKTKFAGDNKTIEIDQKTANEILVKSTPNQNAVLQLKRPDPVPTVSLEPRLPQISNQISVTKVNIPPKPVVKLLTYPAPPLTGGIAITNEDLNCLNEGEFLNDAIIDFYLKYLFHEKLSPYYQERTHIFSSFFYPRLTHRQDRPRGDDANKTMPVRRHNQVKTWTRHVDIFSKDYIIIPVNQNVHWFLAVICYPSRVPDAPTEQEKKLNDSAALNDSVTSTNEHVHKVTIKEITSNGEDDSQNLDDSMNSGASSPYEVEEPPDSDDCSETPDSTTNPDGKQRREMPCICIFDSLSGPSRVRIATVLREYLELEWKCKKGTKKVFNKSTMQGFVMKCPQQTNFSDCGIYLLQFVESFFEHPIPFCNPMPDLTDWFTEEKINRKRQQLKDLILNLQEKQEAIAARKNQSSSQHSDNR